MQVVDFLGILTMSYGLAFVGSLALESPMMGLEKVVFRKKRDWSVSVDQWKKNRAPFTILSHIHTCTINFSAKLAGLKTGVCLKLITHVLHVFHLITHSISLVNLVYGTCCSLGYIGRKHSYDIRNTLLLLQMAKFMRPTWGPPGSCRPQMDPMLAPWTLLSGTLSF